VIFTSDFKRQITERIWTWWVDIALAYSGVFVRQSVSLLMAVVLMFTVVP